MSGVFRRYFNRFIGFQEVLEALGFRGSVFQGSMRFGGRVRSKFERLWYLRGFGEVPGRVTGSLGHFRGIRRVAVAVQRV